MARKMIPKVAPSVRASKILDKILTMINRQFLRAVAKVN
jgi:hypothetical protein